MSARRSTRRDFLAKSTLTAAPLFVPSHVLGRGSRTAPNDRIEIAVVGCGVRGKYLIANLPDSARVTTLCDCAADRIEGVRRPKEKPFDSILADFAEGDGRHCRTYADYRRLFDEAKADAVVIATPDHHHALAAVLACRAGLDVYLEKPLALTIAGGRAVADAVAEHDRVLQVGSQQRTMEINRFACEFVRDGGLGKVSLVEVPNYPGPIDGVRLAEQPVPAGFDWDLFLGPSSRRPYNRKWWDKDSFKVGRLTWRGWDLFRDFSGHLTTNWGAHSVDMVQYALGADDTGPAEVAIGEVDEAAIERDWVEKWSKKTPRARRPWGRSTRFHPVTMKYSDGTELRFTPDVDTAVFHGEKGTMKISRNKFVVDPADLVVDGPDPSIAAKWVGGGHVARPHLENWLDCIRTRGVPNAPVEVGHRSVTVCHLANTVRELSRPLRWDPDAERFANDDAANALLDRAPREGFGLPPVRGSNVGPRN